MQSKKFSKTLWNSKFIKFIRIITTSLSNAYIKQNYPQMILCLRFLMKLINALTELNLNSGCMGRRCNFIREIQTSYEWSPQVCKEDNFMLLGNK